MLIHYAILALALVGFAIAWYIHARKNEQQALVCFVSNDCNQVVQSSYSHFFSVAQEDLGIIYYLTVFLAQFLFLVFPSLHSVLAARLFFGATALGALYSAYLLYAQFVLIRHWCEWCLLSNIITILLCILAFF